MGKRTRRLMEGFALGALSEVSRQQRVAFETKQAQEAEALREQRLAAIRAEERQHQDRIYERNSQRDDQRFERQLEIESKRDQRELDQQMSAEQRAEARAARERGASFENQRRLMQEQAELRPPENTGYVEYIDADGVPGAMPRDQFNALSREERRGWQFRGDTTQRVASPAQTQPSTQQTSMPRPPAAATAAPQQWVRDPQTGRLVPAT